MKTRANGDVAPPSLEELLDFASGAALTEVVWEKEGRRIAFKRASIPAAPAPLAPAEPALPSKNPLEDKHRLVKSPMVGTFLRAPKGRPPLIVEGDEVSPGHRLGIVEAMQVPKDVISNVKGRVQKVLVENGRPVEYGQPIFEVELTGGA